MRHLRPVNKYFWKYRHRLFAGIGFIILSNYFAILAPQITAYVVDKVQWMLPGATQKPLARQSDPLINLLVAWLESLPLSFGSVVALCGVTILLLAIVRGALMFLMRQTIIVMSRHIEFDQKNEVYAHYQRLDAQFFKSNSVGDLMSRIAEDVSRVRMYTGPAIMYLVNLATLLFFALGHMLAKNAELTLYTLAPMPVLAIIIYFVNNIIHRRSEAIQARLGALTANAQQSYSGIRVIKSYVQEENMVDHFATDSEDYRNQSVGLARVDAIYYPAIQLLIGASTLVTIMIGGLYYLNGKISEIGVIVEFVLYVNMLTFPVSAIGWVAGMIQRASASQKRLNQFLDRKPDIADGPGVQALTSLGSVQFHEVSFTYQHTGVQALRKVSFEVLPGQKLAIIGRTASGKSTVAALLLRLYDPQKGDVLIDGHSLKAYTLSQLRGLISYVPQEVFLFSDTIANNIRFGNMQATQAEVEQAAVYAGIHSEVMRFDKQYETLIGERGVTLSGGQKQRLSIARALLKQAPIIVFDDCLSAVDAKTEQEVLQHLSDFLSQKTAIVITHRIFSLLAFDHILVMDDGEIVESGTHQSLLAQNGTYAELYRQQQLEEKEAMLS
jgi:ATP-binding cassette subfamily B protein